MTINRNRKILVLALGILALGAAVTARTIQTGSSFREFWGPLYSARTDAPNASAQADTASLQADTVSTQAVNPSNAMLVRWNGIAINASGLDHTPVAPGENRVFGEQVGPCRASRAIAIVHIAMFESLNSIVGGFKSYVGFLRTKVPASSDAAIAQSAHDTLAALWPSQKPAFDQKLADDLAAIPAGQPKFNGISIGQKAALAILNLRTNDGSQIPEPKVGIDFITSNEAGKWRQDPISHHPLALGAHWDQVTPFVLASAQQFRVPAFPALNSPEYTAAFNEVKNLGGDGITTPTARTPEQTHIAIFWAYDGTPSLCAPPRLYNQITVQLAQQMNTNGINLARLLALTNVAMADAGIAIWESKYFYQIWRPIGGIRESDPGTGPSGTGDGNNNTVGDPTCMPLGAPASNLMGPNFTPPFPAYPSGHAGFGGALFQVLREFYGTDNIAFTFTSDEFNGVTKDNGGNIRPLLPRNFSSLSQAEEENGQSRIYLGIHWSFDKVQGIAQGRNVGHAVMKRVFGPAK